MAADGPARIALAGEDTAHRILATTLIDEAILAGAAGRPWPEREQLDQARQWTVHADGGCMFTSRRLREETKGLRPRFRTYRLHGAPLGEATWFVDLYQHLVEQDSQAIAAVVILRDTNVRADLDPVAQRAREYIRTQLRGPSVAIGLCAPEAQAWFVSCLTDAPNRDAVRVQLSFDPVQEPARMNSQPGSPREAKRVLDALIGHAADLEALAGSCFRGVPFSRLEESCGLRAFAEELAAQVVPTVLPGPPPRWTER